MPYPVSRLRPKKPELWLSIPAITFAPPEMVTDGSFSGNGPTGNSTTPTGSFNTGQYAIVSGQGRLTNGAAASSTIWFDIPTVAGRTYDIGVTLVAGTSGASCNTAFDHASGVNFYSSSGAGAKSNTVVATGAYIRVYFGTGTATSGHTMFFDNLTVRLNQATECDLIFSQAKALGCTGIRTDFQGEWNFYGNSSARYWTEPDLMATRAQTNGMDLCFCEISSPAWAAASGFTYPTTQLSAWATCLQDAAARYQGVVKYWEIRNEQNLSGFSATTAGGGSIASCASAYMTYATAVAAGIRAGDPRAMIVSTGLSPSPDTVLGNHLKAADYLSEMYNAGAKGVFDMIGFHPYSCPLQPDDPATYNGWQIMETDIRAVMAANGDGNKPILCTEYGFPTGGTSNGSQTTEALTGQAIIRAMHLAKGMNIRAIAYYTSIDKQASQFSSTNNEDYFGIYSATLANKVDPVAAAQYATRMIR